MNSDSIREALDAVRDGQLDKKTEKELRSMIVDLRQLQDQQLAPRAAPAIDAIEHELSRRHATATNKELIAEQQRLHQEMLAETRILRKPGFVVIFLTMICAAIAAWPVIRDWIPAFRPAGIAASFQMQQSNSAPVIPTGQKTSSVPPAAIQGTNQMSH
ncbi:MAG: hypothetical protein ABSD29_13645 [Verrucomicrobiota bacterium]|jgi:hypothetical protein